MKWWMHWLSQLGMAQLPGGRSLHRWMQDRLGEHRRLESSSRFDNAELFLERAISLTAGMTDPRIVEIGTGWIPAVPLTLSAAGLRVETYDVVRHVDDVLYQRTISVLEQRYTRIADVADQRPQEVADRLNRIRDVGDFEAACRVLGGRYSAPSDTTALPYKSGEVDLIVSNLVLQCIPRAVLSDVVAETSRVLAPGGYAVHRIWMADEYAGRDPNRNRLHYLTYSERTWTRWFCHRLKHLNRLRAPQFLKLFDNVGLDVWRCERTVDEQSIPHLKAIPLDEQFQNMSWEDLATTSLEIVLRKPLCESAVDAGGGRTDDVVRTVST